MAEIRPKWAFWGEFGKNWGKCAFFPFARWKPAESSSVRVAPREHTGAPREHTGAPREHERLGTRAFAGALKRPNSRPKTGQTRACAPDMARHAGFLIFRGALGPPRPPCAVRSSAGARGRRRREPPQGSGHVFGGGFRPRGPPPEKLAGQGWGLPAAGVGAAPAAKVGARRHRGEKRRPNCAGSARAESIFAEKRAGLPRGGPGFGRFGRFWGAERCAHAPKFFKST